MLITYKKHLKRYLAFTSSFCCVRYERGYLSKVTCFVTFKLRLHTLCTVYINFFFLTEHLRLIFIEHFWLNASFGIILKPDSYCQIIISYFRRSVNLNNDYISICSYILRSRKMPNNHKNWLTCHVQLHSEDNNYPPNPHTSCKIPLGCYQFDVNNVFLQDSL